MKKKIIITQLLCNIEKVSSIYFLFTVWKKKLTKRKEKKLRRKFFFENILKGKKIKGKEVSCRFIGHCSTMRYLN
jgi:adenine-specific DNA methylase